MEIGSFRNVTVFYNKLKALDDLSFDVKEGEIFGLLGPNGSGKTTTLKIFTGLMKPNSGNASVSNMDIWKNRNKLKKDIGYCPQFNSFNEKLTVRENIKYFAKLYGIKGDLGALAEKICSDLDLTKKIDQRAEHLSGGLKRRLNIICGILHDPGILFLDEPSIGLDPISRSELWKMIKKLRSKGTTIVIATNIMEEAEYLCDRVVLLKNGRSIITGNLAEIRRKVPTTETIVIHTKFSQKVNYQKITKHLRRRRGVIDIEYSTDVIRIKVKAKHGKSVKKYSISFLKKSSITVEDISVIPSSLIDAFEILVGPE